MPADGQAPRRKREPTNERRRTRAVAAVDNTFAAFVPRLAAELDLAPTPSWMLVDGSMLSADISGFTALSERLAGKGKAGAEEITELVNKCFTALINAAYGFGGEVIKFGGDALLVLFRGDNHGRRSVDAGLDMQRALHSSSAAKRARLTMTVGVADGPFDVYLAGTDYREILVTGGRATEVIRLEGAAGKGDTLVSPTLAALLPSAMRMRTESGGVVVVGDTGDRPTGPAPRHLADADLARFVPATVRDQLVAFSGLGGEHRLVTVGFLMVGGVDALRNAHGPDHVAGLFHRLVDDVVAACTAFGVTALHTDIAPDGVKFVLCAGAPVNPGDTGDAMLHCALRISQIATPLTLRQGVQTGRVFAGFLGSEFRRTYTLMGDPVNTAARMLGKAADREIVAVASVVTDTRTVFITEELEPFLVKGKTEPISAHKVFAASDEVRRDNTATRLFGRQRELDVLTHAIGELGEIVVVSGSAGVGKSRLLDAAWDHAEGLRVFQGACTPFGAATPYSVFRPLMRMGTGIDVHADATRAGELLAKIVQQSTPDLLPMLPLLAVPFGARVEPTPESDAIDPEFRRLRIHETVVAFLDAVLTGPILLVIEDAHWIDDASGELTNHLVDAASSRPWAGVITRRPEGSWQSIEADHVVTIQLEPLSDVAIRELAIAASERALSDRDIEITVERSGGNPLFAIELALALSHVGRGEVPDTIEQLIAARFDRLDPDARRLVRVASVLGTVFDESVVSGLLASTNSDTPVSDAFAAAEEAGAIVHRSGTTWAFTHALYRDTVYAGLPFNRRRGLHRSAAALLVAETRDESVLAPTLSLHYAAAHDHERTWQYSLLAGTAARSLHATHEAALAFERALTASRYCRSIGAAERAAVAEELGDTYYVLGRSDNAIRSYQRARRLNNEPILDVLLMRKLAASFERQGNQRRAGRWCALAASAIPHGTTDHRWLSARAQVALTLAVVRSRQGDDQTTFDLAALALQDAEAADDQASRALALERMHLANIYLANPGFEDLGQRAVDAHRAHDDALGLARTLSNIGIDEYFAARWSEASSHYAESLDIATRSGSVVPAATAAINLAEILADQGEWTRAIDLLNDAARNFASVRYPAGTSAAELFTAVCHTRLGHLELAEEALDRSRAALQGLGLREIADDLETRQLELDVLRGWATTARCDQLASQLGEGHHLLPRVRRARGLVAYLDDDPATARSELSGSLASTPDPGFERALTLHALATALPDDPLVANWNDEVTSICSSLGVRRLPPQVPADLNIR